VAFLVGTAPCNGSPLFCCQHHPLLAKLATRRPPYLHASKNRLSPSSELAFP
jgi:hypothetical protein